MRNIFFTALRVFGLLSPLAAQAVQVSGMFRDHMVLQRERPIPVWGTGAPGESVRVQLGAVAREASAGADGKWSVLFESMPAGGPVELTVSGMNTLTVRDILFGDVWLCAGQSNMGTGFTRREALDPGRMDLPGIRYASYIAAAPEPVDDVPLVWSVSSPSTVPQYPAFPWYFAQMLHQETGVPVGLLKVNSGGARIEWFMNPAVVEPRKIWGDWKYQLDLYEKNLPKNTRVLEDWVRVARDAMEKNRPVPVIPHVDVHPSFSPPARFGPFCFYFGTLSCLARLPIKGVAWYQGESNVEDEGLYAPKLKALVEGWRAAWKEPSLPFYFVQLPNVYQPGGLNENPKLWPLLREAQARVLALPHTGMAVTIDVGDEDLHPRNKYDMARRLAAIALARTYGREIECTGPVFRASEARGTRMVLHFDHVGKGLMIGRKHGLDPVEEDVGGQLQEFAIAGPDRKFYTGEAIVEGDTVVVFSEKVLTPVSVRYAFTSNPSRRNLYGRNGLPVAPFRTDHW